jgi:hypothetical protein
MGYVYADIFIKILKIVNYYGLKPIAFGFQASACPPLADNFIYGLPPVVLRRKNKMRN